MDITWGSNNFYIYKYIYLYFVHIWFMYLHVYNNNNSIYIKCNFHIMYTYNVWIYMRLECPLRYITSLHIRLTVPYIIGFGRYYDCTQPLCLIYRIYQHVCLIYSLYQPVCCDIQPIGLMPRSYLLNVGESYTCIC